MLYPSDVSPDGRVLLYHQGDELSIDLWYLSLVGDRTPRPFVETAVRRAGRAVFDRRQVGRVPVE